MNFIIFIAVVILNGYNVAAIEGVPKCSIYNSTCQQNSFQTIAAKYAAVGFPEIGLGPVDPFALKNVEMTIMQILKLTMVEGECLDIGTCRLQKFETDVDNFLRTSEILCARIVIQGQYTLSTNPFFRQMFGDVTGCGNVTIVVEDWYFKIQYPFAFVKHEDGQIYVAPRFDEGYHVSEVLKIFTITADSIKVDGRDITEKVLAFINKYWKIILQTVGKPFHDISMDYYYNTYKTIFNNIPATELLIEDLTPYLEENQKCT